MPAFLLLAILSPRIALRIADAATVLHLRARRLDSDLDAALHDASQWRRDLGLNVES